MFSLILLNEVQIHEIVSSMFRFFFSTGSKHCNLKPLTVFNSISLAKYIYVTGKVSIVNKQFYHKSAVNLLNVIEVIRLQLILFLLDYRFRHHGRL